MWKWNSFNCSMVMPPWQWMIGLGSPVVPD